MRRSSRVQALAQAKEEHVDEVKSPERRTRRKKGSMDSPVKGEESPLHESKSPKKRLSLDFDPNVDSDDDIMDLLKDTREIKQTGRKKKKRNSDPFDSLDALLAENSKEQEKKKKQADRISQLRKETQDIKEQCSLDQMSSEIETNMKDLQADDHLFTIEDHMEVEQFGYVFEPIEELPSCPPFVPSSSDLKGPFKLVFECIKDISEDDLASLLWSQAIPVLSAEIGVEVPHSLCHWLFTLVSFHSNKHIIQGAFLNLFSLLFGGRSNVSTLTAGLPLAMLWRSLTPHASMEWNVNVNDFFSSFRKYGFKESKRGLNSKQKAQAHSSSSVWTIPFPSANMEHVTMLFILALRTKILQPSDYDVCTFCIFFLRMQFEEILRPQLCELSSYCIEVLLDTFSAKEWRLQYAPLLILRIAGVKEGFFQSSSGWLSIARRLPRTERGTQLTTGLAIYILQYRPDSREDQVEISEEPLKFPLQCDLVLDIVSTCVDSLIEKYADNDAREIVPPYDLICTKIALMDLALQAFLNYLQPSEMSLILQKLDALAQTNKATVVVQWHEMKTLVSLMHRKYSAENLRIGRHPSPKAKVVLFIDD